MYFFSTLKTKQTKSNIIFDQQRAKIDWSEENKTLRYRHT